MMEKNFSQAIAAKGIRPSMQRTAIYEYLCTHPTHPTVDAVYRSLSATHPTLSRTTVYSTLRLLAEHGLVQAITIEDDELRYDAEMKPHIHFKCRKCGRIDDVFIGGKIVEFNSTCASSVGNGCKVDAIQTNVWGLCAECAAKSASS